MPRPLPGSTAILLEDISDQAEWPTKYIIDPDSGCWIYQGHILHGYGRATFRGQDQYVHRLFYRLHVGPIADGMTIDHVVTRGCTSKACVNPAHLEEVTQAENSARRQVGVDPTTCPASLHPWPASRHRAPNGVTYCKPCKYARARAVRARSTQKRAA